MCWTSVKPPKLRVAKRDIPCKKLVEKYGRLLVSYYYEHRYYLGKTYEKNTDMEVEIASSYTEMGGIMYGIYEGFHSYMIKKNVESELRFMQATNSGIVIMRCVIPKGSVYYLNEKGDYVSNKIKPISVKEIKSFDKYETLH